MLVVGATPNAYHVASAWSQEVRLKESDFPARCWMGVAIGRQCATMALPTLNVRLVLKTKDDALIGMTYRGVRHGPADVMERIEKGEAVDPTSYYFRINPLFETAAAKYDWINRIVAVGIGHRRTDGPIYSVFEVL